jgi:hypothetical protein
MQEIDEIVQTIDRLQREFDDLAMRGLRTAGPANLGSLKALHEEFERIGAGHLAGHIKKVIEAIDRDDRTVAATLLHAQASLRVFDRVLTLEAAGAMLESMIQSENAAEDEEEEE